MTQNGHLRQPAHEVWGYRVVGELSKTDFVMNQVFWIGVFPVLTREMLDIIVKTESDFVVTAKGEFMVV